MKFKSRPALLLRNIVILWIIGVPIYFGSLYLKSYLYDRQKTDCIKAGYVYEDTCTYVTVGLEDIEQAGSFIEHYNFYSIDSITPRKFDFCDIPFNAHCCIKDSLYVDGFKLYQITYFMKNREYYNNCYIASQSFHHTKADKKTIQKFEKKWDIKKYEGLDEW